MGETSVSLGKFLTQSPGGKRHGLERTEGRGSLLSWSRSPPVRSGWRLGDQGQEWSVSLKGLEGFE